MAYTTINKSSDYFNTKLYTGNGGTQSIDVGFQSDFTWLKSRTETKNNILIDAVRGSDKDIISNLANAENTDANRITGFDSDGFNLGSSSTTNTNSQNYVSWNWKANGTGVSNTSGSINSTVSANTTSGFSVVKWTNSTSNAGTIGHGLGVAPKMILVKTTSGTYNWYVYHKSIGAGNFLELNGTVGSQASANLFDNTEPTTSVFSTGTNPAFINNTMIAYCFAEKQGYSKFSSYIGGGSNFPFIYTGFKPAFVMLKKTSGTGNWQLFDNKRAGYNPDNDVLRPNLSNVECTSCVEIDMLSNGYKLKNTDGDGNTSGGTYIYMAFAEAPLVGTNNVPCNAR